MQLTCPRCGFSRQIAPELLPAFATRATCPQCKTSFPLQRAAAAAIAQGGTTAEPVGPAVAESRDFIDNPESLPKAGFWIRLTAWLIDKFLVFLVQTLLGTLLFLAGYTFIPDGGGIAGPLPRLVWLFTTIINVVYYVLFTGHCGQTPGKMAVRIKVIRRGGQSIGYGRAFLRELPGKFISAALLGIGYLMVAFDDQKQGLHDRLADTYVIKQ